MMIKHAECVRLKHIIHHVSVNTSLKSDIISLINTIATSSHSHTAKVQKTRFKLGIAG